MKAFTLRKNSWHMRYMNFVWGCSPLDFGWMCLYFWLTVATVLFAWLILPVKGTLYVMRKMDKYLEKKEQEHFEALFYNNRNNPKYWERFATKEIKHNSKLDKFLRAIYHYDHDFWNMLEDKQNAFQRAQQTERMNQLYNPQPTATAQLKKAYKYIKPVTTVVFWVVVATFVLVALKGIYKFIMYIIDLKAEQWGNIGYAFLMIIGAAIFILLMTLFFKSSTGDKAVDTVSSSVETGWNYCGRKIKQFFKFIGMLISDNCPAIKWVD